MSQTFFHLFFIFMDFHSHFRLHKQEIAIRAGRVYTSHR